MDLPFLNCIHNQSVCTLFTFTFVHCHFSVSITDVLHRWQEFRLLCSFSFTSIILDFRISSVTHLQPGSVDSSRTPDDHDYKDFVGPSPLISPLFSLRLWLTKTSFVFDPTATILVPRSFLKKGTKSQREIVGDNCLGLSFGRPVSFSHQSDTPIGFRVRTVVFISYFPTQTSTLCCGIIGPVRDAPYVFCTFCENWTSLHTR